MNNHLDITIQHIADRLGLSVSTVSRALNGSYGVHPRTIARVQEAAAELGYVPNLGAKQLVTRRSNLIGVFMPELDSESNRGFDDIFAALRKGLRLYQKEILIFSVPFGEEEYRPGSLSEWVRMRSLEGCVFMQPFGKGHPLIREAIKLQVPSVNMGSAVGPRCSLAVSDNYEGGRMAGSYLLELGHEKLGYINGPEHLSICEDRYRGFCAAFRNGTGTEHDPALKRTGDFSGASGAGVILELMESYPELTAVCCANDMMAMGAIMELARHGISVPEDLSLVGYDGTYFTAYTNPPLSTIRHRFEQIGIRAAELLLELINGGAGRTLKVMPELVRRDSVRSI